MGGRLDAVNVVDADIAIITSIALDHCAALGNDRETIGREKAGILRPGKPLVCGDPNPPSSIINSAKKAKAPLFYLGRDFHYQQQIQSWDWWTGKDQHLALPVPRLHLGNAAAALMALIRLPIPIQPDEIATGLAQIFLPGRCQVINSPKCCLFDVAHNPAATTWLAQQLQDQPIRGRNLAVFGIMQDKAIRAVIQPMLTQIQAWYTGDIGHPRGLPGIKMIDYLQDLNINQCYNHATIREAFLAAWRDCRAQDRVVVFGSFHTVAEAMAIRG